LSESGKVGPETQLSEMTTVGPKSCLTVRSATGSVVALDYTYPVAINCAGDCFDAISVYIAFKLFDDIILHDRILRDDSASVLPLLVLISMQEIKLHELLYASVGGVQCGDNNRNFEAVYETKSA
jgi:hypothetical protein